VLFIQTSSARNGLSSIWPVWATTMWCQPEKEDDAADEEEQGQPARKPRVPGGSAADPA
jgi:hypothetical protein